MKLSQSPRQKRSLHGVLLLDKPRGLSSNEALQKVKRLLQAEKAGHTGTLDPMATGVLPICFGAATKFSQMHLEADKSYEAVAVLGVKTTTGDALGEVIERRQVPFGAAEMLEKLNEAQEKFTGPYQQVPPMYSALKKDGRALYEYARAGVEVERAPRAVVIHSLLLEDLGDAVQLEDNALGQKGERVRCISIKVRCSKGTYIRTLAEDIGAWLGCEATLSMLRRTQTGDFDDSQCFTLETLCQMQPAEILRTLMPCEVLLSGCAQVDLEPADAGKFLAGMRRRGDWPSSELVAVFGTNPRALLGTAHVVGGELISQRLLNVKELQSILDQSLEKSNDTSN